MNRRQLLQTLSAAVASLAFWRWSASTDSRSRVGVPIKSLYAKGIGDRAEIVAVFDDGRAATYSIPMPANGRLPDAARRTFANRTPVTHSEFMEQLGGRGFTLRCPIGESSIEPEELQVVNA